MKRKDRVESQNIKNSYQSKRKWKMCLVTSLLTFVLFGWMSETFFEYSTHPVCQTFIHFCKHTTFLFPAWANVLPRATNVCVQEWVVRMIMVLVVVVMADAMIRQLGREDEQGEEVAWQCVCVCVWLDCPATCWPHFRVVHHFNSFFCCPTHTTQACQWTYMDTDKHAFCTHEKDFVVQPSMAWF